MSLLIGHNLPWHALSVARRDTLVMVCWAHCLRYPLSDVLVLLKHVPMIRNHLHEPLRGMTLHMVRALSAVRKVTLVMVRMDSNSPI